LYLDQLVQPHAERARHAIGVIGWGVPGLSWTPGEVPDPGSLSAVGADPTFVRNRVGVLEFSLAAGEDVVVRMTPVPSVASFDARR
jgi:hypothetical protein